ncbi:MAG: 2-amino-4-hydroxy-6-hydroxymethyldihydropteridine pyrophosphokinase [Candidatus Nomurabacteria bacterium GW2011_GWA2_40_9]|uniref:2-amino-4-hydroxy-6-hydroxymethyldihydropteridine diphosphokinase n=1 Tax=Candidatus Nomurabacteria bacterium GW2011_GWA2_40_9 TaxID=1618734 RepID=A0A0G0W5K0_9BACT|nr:MAG: 2-amino-4-hydroxy-6-hydroxymethyldihydropteridine pyrophosphokinase [Candidatus Nomurabacteria bacterium GW2011_GWA2_40_9]
MKSKKHIAYIGIGSNLGGRLKNCKNAVQKINQHPEIFVIKTSSWIETEPIGYTDQPKFMNGAIEIKTSLTPQKLLKTLQQIEKGMGRKKTFKWGPRIIDLDILLYDNQVIQTSKLTIPHSHLKEREFVKIPLLEINSNLNFIFDISSNS